MRGKVITPTIILVTTRITPACAGKRTFPLSAGCQSQDHPRVCGEKYSLRALHSFKKGSPPRVRGKEVLASAPWMLMRITPACAGKRAVKKEGCRAYWDHPRVCGEKFTGGLGQPAHAGSPPRVRGKVFDKSRHLSYLRITPACAGKRSKKRL